MITEKAFQQNLKILKERVALACSSENRSVNEVAILPVTKNWPVDAVHYAQRAGFSRVGENRVQEAMEKQEGVEEMKWDLIGHLQRYFEIILISSRSNVVKRHKSTPPSYYMKKKMKIQFCPILTICPCMDSYTYK